ncbi:Aldo-keto reductase AKR2E4, partial [Gryllus bimaculatus]
RVPSVTPLTEPVVLNIAKKYKKSPAQVLLRHLIQRGIAVIPKSSNPKRIKENIDVFDFELTTDEMDDLNALDKGRRARIFNESSQPFDAHPEFPYRDFY